MNNFFLFPFALPIRGAVCPSLQEGCEGVEGRTKKRVFQALVPKSLALRGMERIVGINRMLGGREGGREREREREERERERAALGSPRENVLASVLCLLGGSESSLGGGTLLASLK